MIFTKFSGAHYANFIVMSGTSVAVLNAVTGTTWTSTPSFAYLMFGDWAGITGHNRSK